MFPQIVSKCYIFCINFYIMFVLLSNIFILCQIDIIISVDRLGHVLNLTQIFSQCTLESLNERRLTVRGAAVESDGRALMVRRA